MHASNHGLANDKREKKFYELFVYRFVKNIQDTEAKVYNELEPVIRDTIESYGHLQQ